MPAELELTEVTIAEVERQVVDLEVEVAVATVRARVRSVFRALSREANLPGFRKGKAPKELLRRMIGAERLRQEVTDELVAAAYERALSEQSLQPLERASIEILHYDEEAPLRFKARVTLRPVVTLPDYLGVAIEQEQATVTEAEFAEQVERIRQSHAVLQEVDRIAQSGDVVTANLTVLVEDETEPRVRELGPLELGAGHMVPAIDEHLIGLKLDNEKAFTMSYPDDYGDETLRSKRAEFKVVITSVKEKELPELDDELAQTVSAEFKTLDDLRTRIRTRLQEGKTAEARSAARKQVEQTVIAGAKLELSESWVERRVTERFAGLIQQLTQQQSTLDEFLVAQATEAETLKLRFREEVMRDSIRELVLQEIAQKESLAVEPVELERELLGFARATGQEPRELAERLVRTGALRAFEVAVFERKVGDWLLERAQVNYIEKVEAA